MRKSAFYKKFAPSVLNSINTRIKTLVGSLRKFPGVKSFIKTQKVKTKYKRIVKEQDIYFSIEIANAGFTDLLRKFVSLYKLGKFLGLKYYHIPFSHKPLVLKSVNMSHKTRKTSGDQKYADVFDFIGLNSYFTTLNDEIQFDEIRTLDLDDKTINRHKITNFIELVRYLKTDISESIESPGRPVLFKFNLKSQLLDLNWINNHLPHSKIDFNLREIYFNYREKNPRPIKFEKSKTKLLIHIRQGDTATIQTPWNTFIRVWGRMENSFLEFNSIEDINDNRILTVSDYYHFYKNLLNGFENSYFSTLQFSDGFARSFLQLFNHIDRFNFSQSQENDLKESVKTYNSKAFGVFDELKDIEMIIGEEPEKLYDLIHSFLHTDIVIIGTQQRMIPKLVAFYCNIKLAPLVVVLYKQLAPDYRALGIPRTAGNFIYVNLNNYDISKIILRIKAILASKNQKKG